MGARRGRAAAAVAAALIGIAALAAPGTAEAARAYPTNRCVAKKEKLAGAYCGAVLRAWARWHTSGDDAARDAAIARAAARLDAKWLAAETKAADAGAACAETTIPAADLRAAVDAAAAGLAATVEAGLDLADRAQARCARRLLAAAAARCARALAAEGRFVRNPARDPEGTRLDAAIARADAALDRAWTRALAAGCPTTATVDDARTALDALRADVVRDTRISPAVDASAFELVTPPASVRYLGETLEPLCALGGQYHFFAKRGSVNRLLVYYQGGGACWEQLTCSVPTCDQSVDPLGSDNPNNFSSGLADLSNPANPFRDWNIVVVPYCSCDVHFGDASQDYANVNPGSPIHIEHRGYHNARVVEKWAREHFVAPEVVFVTGSSAGAYGAVFHAPLLHEAWPAAQFAVLGDGGNGVITTSFLQNEFSNWNFTAHIPKKIPGLLESITEGTGMVGYITAVGAFFPKTRWAHYTTAFDGGSGGQTGFYAIMLNGNNPFAALTWWTASCAFNDAMRTQAIATAAAVPNYRYYIGSGSAHTIWGRDRAYTDTTGGVPTLVSWLEAMIEGTPDWVNVEASPSNVLLPGDPRPDPLAPPFEQVGADIVVNCP